MFECRVFSISSREANHSTDTLVDSLNRCLVPWLELFVDGDVKSIRNYCNFSLTYGRKDDPGIQARVLLVVRVASALCSILRFVRVCQKCSIALWLSRKMGVLKCHRISSIRVSCVVVPTAFLRSYAHFWFLWLLSKCCVICRLHVGHAVAQWLRHCATNRKNVGSIPDSVTGLFSLT
jgi:hypothetical protein